jgi:hypothetical protein
MSVIAQTFLALVEVATCKQKPPGLQTWVKKRHFYLLLDMARALCSPAYYFGPVNRRNAKSPPPAGECPRLRRPRIMIENPHFPRSYSHKTGLDVLVFDQEVDLGLIFDRKQWISTPGCTMLDFDTPP